MWGHATLHTTPDVLVEEVSFSVALKDGKELHSFTEVGSKFVPQNWTSNSETAAVIGFRRHRYTVSKPWSADRRERPGT